MSRRIPSWRKKYSLPLTMRTCRSTSTFITRLDSLSSSISRPRNTKLDMLAAEAKLKQFAGEQGGVAPATMRDMTLQKLADFKSSLSTTRASIAESQRRIADLEKQAQQIPARLTTQKKLTDNAQVLENLKASLLTLENKRTELLTKYQPTYPLVQEVDKAIE